MPNRYGGTKWWEGLFSPATCWKHKLLEHPEPWSWDISLFRSRSFQSSLSLIDTEDAVTWTFSLVWKSAYEATAFNHSYSFQSPHHKLVYSQEVAPEIWGYFADSDYICWFNFPVTVQTNKEQQSLWRSTYSGRQNSMELPSDRCIQNDSFDYTGMNGWKAYAHLRKLLTFHCWLQPMSIFENLIISQQY